MIDMSMGEQNSVELSHCEWERPIFLDCRATVPLKQAAVKQNLPGSILQQMTGTCDFVGPAKKAQRAFHQDIFATRLAGPHHFHRAMGPGCDDG